MPDDLDLTDGIARHLMARGLLIYDPTGLTGDCFIEAMPEQPDAAVCLTLYGGPEPDSRLPYDEPRLQVRVRGGPDPRVSRKRAMALYDELHGLGPVDLPDGSQLLSCRALQTVSSMGRDEVGRFDHLFNCQLETFVPGGTHRP